MSENLNGIKIVTSELTGIIYIARFGNDKNISLDKRPAEAELMASLITHMFYDAGNATGVTKHIMFGKDKYKIVVEKVKE